MRLEVVKNALNRMHDGDPAFILSPKCRVLRKGFAGSYHYKLIKGGDGTRTHKEPDKNKFSHPHDGLQYLLLGGGEAGVVMNKSNHKPTAERYNNSPRIIDQIQNVKHKQSYDPFSPRGSYKPKGW